MKNFKIDLHKKIVSLDGTRKYWWKIKHKSSSSSEEATDFRAWYTDSKKYGYLIDENGAKDDKLKISEIENLDKHRGEMEGPIDWIFAEHRTKTPETLQRLNKLVDRAEKEERAQEAKKHKAASDVPGVKEDKVHSRLEREAGRSMKPPAVKRVSETEYEVDWGKYVYSQDMGEWTLRKHGDGESEWHRERNKKIRRLLEKVIAEFKEHESEMSERRKSPERKEPTTESQCEKSAPRKNSDSARDIETPPFRRITNNQLKSGKFIWHRNEDGRWFRIQSPQSKKGKLVREKDWVTLDKILSELGGPIQDKNPNASSKQKNPKRPKFAERNKHGGLIIHGLADSRYYTRFDIGKSKKYPKGYTFRVNRGKLYILETMDRQSLAAIENEIASVLQSKR